MHRKKAVKSIPERLLPSTALVADCPGEEVDFSAPCLKLMQQPSL